MRIDQKTNANLILILMLIILFALSVYYLFYSKPNTKFIYIFQRYILKKDPFGLEFLPPKTGKFKTWYKNGQIREEGEYKNGLSHGFFIEYEEDGKIKSIGRYVNGQKDGEHVLNIKGQIFIREIYSNGTKIKTHIFYGKP